MAFPVSRNTNNVFTSIFCPIVRKIMFFEMGQPRPLFVYFRSFQQQLYIKIAGFREIRTRIIEVEGEHSDYLTTNTAPPKIILKILAPKLPNPLLLKWNVRGWRWLKLKHKALERIMSRRCCDFYSNTLDWIDIRFMITYPLFTS